MTSQVLPLSLNTHPSPAMLKLHVIYLLFFNCYVWVLRIAKVGSTLLPYWGNIEEQKSWRWPFSFFQNSFIFRFCFGLKVSTDFPEFSKILCSFVTKTTIIYFKKSWFSKTNNCSFCNKTTQDFAKFWEIWGNFKAKRKTEDEGILKKGKQSSLWFFSLRIGLVGREEIPIFCYGKRPSDI